MEITSIPSPHSPFLKRIVGKPWNPANQLLIFHPENMRKKYSPEKPTWNPTKLVVCISIDVSPFSTGVSSGSMLVFKGCKIHFNHSSSPRDYCFVVIRINNFSKKRDQWRKRRRLQQKIINLPDSSALKVFRAMNLNRPKASGRRAHMNGKPKLWCTMVQPVELMVNWWWIVVNRDSYGRLWNWIPM